MLVNVFENFEKVVAPDFQVYINTGLTKVQRGGLGDQKIAKKIMS